MQLINLTPHTVRLRDTEGQILSIPSSGVIARLAFARELDELVEVEGHKLPINRSRARAVLNLPPPESGTLYIVSALVGQAVRRPDLLGVDQPEYNDHETDVRFAKALARFEAFAGGI